LAAPLFHYPAAIFRENAADQVTCAYYTGYALFIMSKRVGAKEKRHPKMP